MSDRAQKYEAYLDDLALVVDGDPEALERHADFLADDDQARDLRHEAQEVVAEIAASGADFEMPDDFEETLLAAVDTAAAETPAPEEKHVGRTTSPGFSAPDAARKTPSTVAMPASQIPVDIPHTIPPEAPSTPKAPDAASSSSSKRSWGKLLFFPGVAAIGLAAAAAIGLVVFSGAEEETRSSQPSYATSGIEGTLEHIDRAANDDQSGVTIERPGQEGFVALTVGEAVAAGSTLRTDERTRARVSLSDGSNVVLNHATELALVGDTPRSFRLGEGEVVADINHLDDGPNAAFDTPTGRVDVLGTKFVLSATNDVTSVRVSRGVVSVVSTGGAGGTTEASEVHAGEEGLLRAGIAPSVAAVTDLASSMAWSELDGGAGAEEDEDAAIAGIGSLRARRPGQRSDREVPLTLARHEVRVRIVGNVARTEIEEVFRNDSDHTLEGIYKFPLPADAQIARLALDVEGRMEEGAFVERDRAARIWRGVIRNATAPRQRRNDEEFIWVPGPWRDPAILEWQRGGQFELRIFPIPAHGERRVILAYTQTVQPQGARRRYVYPMAHSADDSTRVGEFSLDVRVAGAQRVESSGYRTTSTTDGDATRLTFNDTGFSPKGDLVIDYELDGGERALRWWTYRGDAALAPPADARNRDREVLDIQRQLAGDTRAYVAFALRPDLPRATRRRRRDYVLMVDASQSMVGERYGRAANLASRLVSEMDRRDRFTVLACDYQCRAMPGGMQAPSTQASRATSEWLSGIEPAGASDLVAVLRAAAAMSAGDRQDGRELQLMYIGDGASSVGYRRAAAVSAEVRELASAENITVSTVGIGGDADTQVLRAVARSAGGHYVPYVPGQRVSVAALTVLETSYGASLESPRVELPDGVTQIAPAQIPTLRAGQEVIVVGRMERPDVTGRVTLSGTVAGQPFRQGFDANLVASDAAGNRFVPQLWAAGQIEEMQLSGRGEDRARIIATSKAFGVLSRHTSLLVLESEAMFRAFRVDRREATAHWTGEEDLVTGEVAEDVSAQLGALGYGQGAGRAGNGGGGARGLMGAGRSSGPFALRTRAASGRRSAPPRPRRGRASRPATGGDMDLSDRWADTEAEDELAPRSIEARRPAPPEGGLAATPRADTAGAAEDAAPRDNRMREQQARALPGATAPPPPPAQPSVVAIPPSRRPGSWMRRVSFRTGAITTGGAATEAQRRRASEAEAALNANPDSRDRHREAVRRLALSGQLARALEVAEAWVARDRLDPEALTAKADLVGRMGHRDEALRLLTGTVDLSPGSESLHNRLVGAFERAGRPERACAHRIALAEIDESDAGALAAAMRCERALGRDDAAARLLMSVREASVRTRAERLLRREASSRRFRGDFTIEADWPGADAVDISVLTSQGTRLSWMGGRTTVVGENANGQGEERLGLRWTAPGTYLVEVSRTDASNTNEIRGRLRIRVLGQRRTVPFTLVGERAGVARVRVTRSSRLEPVTGTVGR